MSTKRSLLVLEQWRLNLIEYRAKIGMPYKQIAEKIDESERSVTRLFNGEAKRPDTTFVRKVIKALGAKERDIFGDDGDSVNENVDLGVLQGQLDGILAELELSKADVLRLTGELEAAKSALVSLDQLRSENTDLKIKNAELNSELKHARREIELLDEVIWAYKNCFKP